MQLLALRTADLKAVLERYNESELSENDVETWANLIEGREDVEIDEGAKETLFELANPGLTQPLSKVRSRELLQKLQG